MFTNKLFVFHHLSTNIWILVCHFGIEKRVVTCKEAFPCHYMNLIWFGVCNTIMMRPLKFI